MKKLKVNDLFCGAGGMGQGFKQGGFEIAGAWDFDKYAVQSYKHNVGDHVVQANVLEMTHEDMPYADVWTFGAPCQAFSIAGKQLGMTFKCPSCKHEEQFEGELIIDRQTFCSECGTLSEPKDIRGIMFFEVMRLLKTTEDKPPVIMLENVKGIKKFLDVIEYEYEKRGYKLYQTLYNSKFWGVPQNRERYFVVGVHESIEKEFEFPIQQDKYIPRLTTILETEVDEKYYVDPEKTKNIISRVIDELEHHKLLDDQGRNKEHKLHDISPTIKAEEHGNNKKVIVETKIINVGNTNPSGKGMNGNVIHEDGLSSTLTTNKGEGIKVMVNEGINVIKNGKEFHSMTDLSVTLCARDYKGLAGNQPSTAVLENLYRIRKLTPREYARLQGFPEDFEIVVSNSQAYKQFGNAVTVNVSQAIAERIKMFLLSM